MQQKGIWVNYMNDITFPKAYACYNKNIDTRSKSTSGGVTTLIAEYVIKECGGVVFGAAFDSEFNVVHMKVDTLEELDKIRGSKYPQSNIGNCFKEAKECLISGITVLFIGTPCQISGLKRFLGKEYTNLLCLDFVCHGVASPGVWSGYLNECKNINEITEIVFKDKIKGWKRWHVKIRYKDHTWYRRGGMEPFMRSFLGYANIRPSCFHCRFKGLSRESDFTVSDCWGIGEENKRLNDDMGLSALLIQNETALKIFKKISSDVEYEEYNAEELMEGNWTTFKSVPPNKNREKFFIAYEKRGAKYALKKYFKPTLKSWLAYYYKRMKGREK